MPKWGEMVLEEDSHEVHELIERTFTQKGNVKFDREKLEIKYDIIDQTNHVFNQSHKVGSKDKMWDLLLDN